MTETGGSERRESGGTESLGVRAWGWGERASAVHRGNPSTARRRVFNAGHEGDWLVGALRVLNQAQPIPTQPMRYDELENLINGVGYGLMTRIEVAHLARSSQTLGY